MRYIWALLIVFLLSCNSQKQDIELEIITKEINCFNIPNDADTHTEYLKHIYNEYNTEVPESSKTILVYKLTNNTNKTYYFNIDSYENNLMYEYIKVDNAFLGIYNSNGEYQKPKVGIPTKGADEAYYYKEFLDYSSYLDYTHGVGEENRNFIIHPNETLYFEWFVILPFGNLIEDANYNVFLNSTKEYYAEILMHSDSINYKNILSRTDIKTIDENGCEIYNGTIKSINRVPVVFKTQ